MPDNQKIINKIKAKNWEFYVSRKFNWFVENTQILVNSSEVFEKYLGFDCSLKNYLILNGDEYFCLDDLDGFNGVFKEKFSKDENFFENFSNKIFRIVSEIDDYKRKLVESDFSTYSNSELADEIRKFQDIYTLSFVPGWSRPDDFMQSEISDLLKSELGLSESETENLFAKIATCPPLGELDYSDEPLRLLEIAKEIKGQNIDIDNLPREIVEKIDAHLSKYSWMKGPILIEEIQFEKDEYLQRIELMLTKSIDEEIEKIIKARAQRVADYEEMIGKYSLSPTLRKLIDAIRKFIFLRTYTTEASDSLFFLARKRLLHECGKRLNLTSDEIVLIQSDEIADLLVGDKLDVREVISKRQKGFAILWIDGKVAAVFGDEALLIQKMMPTEEKAEKLQEIRGRSASPGVIQGVAKVLLSYTDVNKVDRGDILVASMTTPDYISAMEKAAAFVTDEGGITCHAAVVSREFGVPCVVGTKFATKVIRDGDIIEVDADKGTVKKIEASI